MDSAAKLEKAFRRDPTLMPSRTVVRMATSDGANLLGLPNVGRIAVGMKADLITIDLNKPHLTPLYHEYSHLVYSVKGSDVDTVIIDGRLIMHQRKLLTFDEREAMAKVRELSNQIKATFSLKPVARKLSG
jgi:5-methylthioadenosine/S-adenosylhomocysteine deaminase